MTMFRYGTISLMNLNLGFVSPSRLRPVLVRMPHSHRLRLLPDSMLPWLTMKMMWPSCRSMLPPGQTQLPPLCIRSAVSLVTLEGGTPGHMLTNTPSISAVRLHVSPTSGFRNSVMLVVVMIWYIHYQMLGLQSWEILLGHLQLGMRLSSWVGVKMTCLKSLRIFIEWQNPSLETSWIWQWTNFLIAHLFSGRRRFGNVHSFLHIVGQGKQVIIQVVVLSLDTANSIHYGNLQVTSVTWNRLIDLYERGLIAATLTGALRETRSEARHQLIVVNDNEVPDTRRWPTFKECVAHLWTGGTFSIREIRQLSQLALSSICRRWCPLHGPFKHRWALHQWAPSSSSRSVHR